MRALIPHRAKPAAKAPTRRRRRISLWKAATWLAVLAPWALIGGLTAGIVWVVWSEGGPDSFAARAKSEALLASLRLGFEIDQVWVKNLHRSDRGDVLAAVGAVRGEPILEFDPKAARARLLELPWIKDAVVARTLPRQIHVDLTERVPVALWQLEHRLTVIDADGDVVPGIAADGFGRLPILVGKGANDEVRALMALVGETPEIARRMTAAVFVAERRWTIRIDDRIDLRLPADAPGAALARLVAIDREQDLFGRDIVAIDLRLNDRLIVRMAPGAADAPTAAAGRPS